MVNTEIRLIILFVAKDGESESESHSVMSDSLKPLDYTVHGILQTRILEWVAFPFSRGSSQPRDQTRVSRIADRFFSFFNINLFILIGG